MSMANMFSRLLTFSGLSLVRVIWPGLNYLAHTLQQMIKIYISRYISGYYNTRAIFAAVAFGP